MPPKRSVSIPEPTTAVVIAAAGSGTRLGAFPPKAFVQIDGRTLLEWALDPVFAIEPAVQVIVVVPRGVDIDIALGRRLTVVTGEDSRQRSVAAGIAATQPAITTVLVHDAARPFTPVEQFERVIAAVEATGEGVIPSLSVIDTIKRVDAGVVVATVDRSELVAVQTPQGFPAEKLRHAYNAATKEYTDDAALFAADGNTVTVVAGHADAFKITTPADLRRAEVLVATADRVEAGDRSTEGSRVGTGIDVHAYDDTSELWLGGLHWPGERGLSGHSDGDVLSHAICDALLSAAGLGDIGSRFGTDDPRFAGAHGDVFISETVRLVSEAGFTVVNVSAQVIANAPKIAPRRAEVQAVLMALVGAPVSVSATTSDGLGLTGRGEGAAVIATALLRSSQ